MNIINKNIRTFFVLAVAMLLVSAPLLTYAGTDEGFDSYDDSGYTDTSYDSGYDSGYDDTSYDSPYDSGYTDTSYDSPYDTSYDDTSYDSPYDAGYTDTSYDSSYPEASYEAPSVSYGSYTAPSASYASYTSGATYAAPVYTAPVYTAPVYTAPPVYTPPVYTPPVYTPPVYNTLQASCYAQNTNVNVNQSVTWVVNASGGNGSYSYTWGGQNLNGYSGQSVTTSYNSPGNETATVSVFSNGHTINVNCGSIVVNQYQTVVGGITASCYANVASAVVGTPVTWTAVVNGGNGNYSFSWTDNNGVSTQSSTGPTFTTTYPIAGSKAPRLTVSSLGSYGYGYNGNGSVTVTCQPIGINSGYNAAYTTTYIAPPPSGSLATLTSVSLNQVPYTGLADSAGFWEFMVGLFLASLGGTWYFMKFYARGKRRYMINLFKKGNLAKKMAV